MFYFIMVDFEFQGIANHLNSVPLVNILKNERVVSVCLNEQPDFTNQAAIVVLDYRSL